MWSAIVTPPVTYGTTQGRSSTSGAPSRGTAPGTSASWTSEVGERDIPKVEIGARDTKEVEVGDQETFKSQIGDRDTDQVEIGARGTF